MYQNQDHRTTGPQDHRHTDMFTYVHLHTPSIYYGEGGCVVHKYFVK